MKESSGGNEREDKIQNAGARGDLLYLSIEYVTTQES